MHRVAESAEDPAMDHRVAFVLRSVVEDRRLVAAVQQPRQEARRLPDFVAKQPIALHRRHVQVDKVV